jgi:hypothetical protein
MGAFIASDAGSITGWASQVLIVLMGITGIGMGLLDSIGSAFLFNGWRITMPKNGMKWPFKFKILTFFVFALVIDGLIILVPFTVSRVTGKTMEGIMGLANVWWWATAVNVAPYMLLGGIMSGNANMISDDSPTPQGNYQESGAESYQKVSVNSKKVQPISTDWRKVRPKLTYQQVVQLSQLEVSDIQKAFPDYNLSDRTAWNWREYAKSEIAKQN